MNQKSGAPVCRHQALAESPLGSVSLCLECGVVQLTMDSVTVRLDLEAFQMAAQMMLVARCRCYELMDERSRPAATPITPLVAATVH